MYLLRAIKLLINERNMKQVKLTKAELDILKVLLDTQILGIEEDGLRRLLEGFNVNISYAQVENLYSKLKY